MSVIASEREEGKLLVLAKSLDLVKYTVHICGNEKHFPKRGRWLITQDIVREAKDQFANIRKANSINCKTKEEYIKRHLLQVDAYGNLETLLSFIDIAYNEFSLPSNKIEHWVGLCLDVENYLKKWTNSDTKRFGE